MKLFINVFLSMFLLFFITQSLKKVIHHNAVNSNPNAFFEIIVENAPISASYALFVAISSVILLALFKFFKDTLNKLKK